MPATVLPKKKITVGLLSIYFVAAMIHATQGIFLSYYISDYQLTSVQQGLSGTIESIGLIIAVIFSAIIVKKIGRARALLTVFSCMILAMLSLSLRLPYGLICISYMLFGISYGSGDALAGSILSDLYQEHSGQVMSYVRAAYSVGGMMTPVILNMLLQRWTQWRHSIGALGIVTLGIFLFYALTTHRHIPEAQSDATIQGIITWEKAREFCLNKKGTSILGYAALYGAHQIGLTIWIVRYVDIYLGDSMISPYSLTGYWIGVLTARLFLPKILHKCTDHLRYGSLAAGILLIVGIFCGNSIVFCILMLFVGFAEGTSAPMMAHYACLVDPAKSATACSLIVTVSNIGGMVSPILIGTLIGLIGVQYGIFILPLTSIGCALISWRMNTNTESKVIAA